MMFAEYFPDQRAAIPGSGSEFGKADAGGEFSGEVLATEFGNPRFPSGGSFGRTRRSGIGSWVIEHGKA